MKVLTLLAVLVFTASSALAADSSPLRLKVYNAGDGSFHVNSTLVVGETEAAVIDTGFTKADALRIAANVLDSGAKLTTIFISQADPDYYFGAEVLKGIFPDAKVLATPEVLKILEKKKAGKLAFWGPKMGPNAPVNPVSPMAFTETSFTVDGHHVEIHGRNGILAHRPYLWIPSLKAIVGNVAVFGGVHVWTADTQSAREQEAWLTQLDEMDALKPLTVVPGHMKAGTSLNSDTIAFTRNYLNSFRRAKKSSENSAALIASMAKQYPDAPLRIALDIGAKVHKGEMKW